MHTLTKYLKSDYFDVKLQQSSSSGEILVFLFGKMHVKVFNAHMTSKTTSLYLTEDRNKNVKIT